MSGAVLCITCGEEFSHRVMKYRKYRQLEEYKFMNTMELLALLFPDEKDSSKTELNMCCIGNLMTYVDNTTQINSFNPQKTIKPYIRR